MSVFVFICLECTGFCPGNKNAMGAKVFSITFDNGSAIFLNKTADDFGFKTGHRRKDYYDRILEYGHYWFLNKIPPVDRWHKSKLDNTKDDTDGYMYVLNIGDSNNSPIFEYTVHNLTLETSYEFSAYLTNIQKRGHDSNDPNILFQVNEIATAWHLANSSTGDIEESNPMTWKKYGVAFKASNASVVLRMISIHDDREGNNLAIDDIELRACSNQSSTSSTG